MNSTTQISEQNSTDHPDNTTDNIIDASMSVVYE
jgi:hypothetical protein